MEADFDTIFAAEENTLKDNALRIIGIISDVSKKNNLCREWNWKDVL